MTTRAIVFDLYGTLLDIDALVDVAAPHVASPHAFVVAWRQKQIEYAFTTSLSGRYDDFDRLTARALDYVAEAFAVTLDAAAQHALLESWLALPPHVDSARALDAVATLGYKRIVLTNGVPASAHRALAAGGLESRIDSVLSVSANRLYKPAPDAYRVATAHLRCEPREILFVSSNGWDAAGAATFGFRVIWCNRKGAPRERIGVPPVAEIRALDDLAVTIENVA